jgi:hypothetical protein
MLAGGAGLYALGPEIPSNGESLDPINGSTDQSALRSRFIVNSISPPASDRGTPSPSGALAPVVE